MYYSKGGFYSAEIHGAVPADAVEITAEHHAALLAGQSIGKVILSDVAGRPYLGDPPPPSAAALGENRKRTAMQYLISSDWYFARQAETGQLVPADVLGKRAEARAILNEA